MNVALILGLALAISGVRSPRDSVRRDFRVALIVPVITGLLFLDGLLSRLDGIVMLSLFVAWFVAVVVEAKKQRKSSEKAAEKHNRALQKKSSLVDD